MALFRFMTNGMTVVLATALWMWRRVQKGYVCQPCIACRDCHLDNCTSMAVMGAPGTRELTPKRDMPVFSPMDLHMRKNQHLRVVLFMFSALLASFADAEEDRVPQFSSFPVVATYTGDPANVVLSTPQDSMFSTRLREAAKYPPNFSGEYVLSAWGCGTTCLTGAVVSLRTGRVVFLPGSICCWEGEAERLIFRKDSRLLVMAGLVNEGGEHGAHFYEFTGSSFRYLKTVPIPAEH
jgi:hypothetical protein